VTSAPAPTTDVSRGAVVGGVGGTAVGAGYGYTKNREGYNQAYAACMQGKGYTVGR
jgi:hypothetical protein